MSRDLNKILNYSLIKISLIPLMLLVISTLVYFAKIAPESVDAILGSEADDSERNAEKQIGIKYISQ